MSPSALLALFLLTLAPAAGAFEPSDDLQVPVTEKCRVMRAALLDRGIETGAVRMDDLVEAGWALPAPQQEYADCGIPLVRAPPPERMGHIIKPGPYPEHPEDICMPFANCASDVGCLTVVGLLLQCVWTYASANRFPGPACTSCVAIEEGGGGAAYFLSGSAEVAHHPTCGWGVNLGAFGGCWSSSFRNGLPGGTCSRTMSATSHGWTDLSAGGLIPIQVCA